jgi:hypothetical protein
MSADEFAGTILVIPAKDDPEREQVAAAWTAGGGEVVRVDRFWDPPALDPKHVRLYGNDTFCLVLAQKWGMTLVVPPDDLLLRVPPAVLRRRVRGHTLVSISAEAFRYS